MLQNLKLISAGAGSGKTYRLTQEMAGLLTDKSVRPSGIIATTFTKRAAAELKERVRVKLLEEGMTREANELSNALIGTVHGLGVKLLRRFAYEAGVSPRVDILADGDDQRIFNLSMAAVTSLEQIAEIEGLCVRLSLSRNGEKYDWRSDVRGLVEVIRGNNFSAADIARSKHNSWQQLRYYLPPPETGVTLTQYNTRVARVIGETYAALLDNEADGTKKTQQAATYLRDLLRDLRQRNFLPWVDYAKLGRFAGEVGAKSRELVQELAEIGERHGGLPAFQEDLRRYQELLFDAARDSIQEYDNYKKSRGRIDYTDMEVLVLRLLDNPGVRETLSRELDLLMVDEFQDTSPMQLAIFLRLSALAKQSVWVGDPKQSIYGFRGAEPRLMAAVMEANGPLDPKNIQRRSWRSREDIVYACNSLFVSAFPEFPPEAVALEPVRTRGGGEFARPEGLQVQQQCGLEHWYFEVEGRGRHSARFMQATLAKALGDLLANPPMILPKGATTERRLRAGDVAILCRSNYGCKAVAEQLARQGISTAIARAGLMDTAETTLLMACLKYLLNPNDSLSVAEILLFGERMALPDIAGHRLDYLRLAEEGRAGWGADQPLLIELDALRATTGEHSTSELLDTILETTDLRRIAVAWGEGEQRLSNLDELRRLAATYEDACHRRHRAASLGGFLLYLDGLIREEKDMQGASERDDAVNVLTYHRSKGLEWPAVICMNADQKLRASVWGRAVVADDPSAPVDLNDPLANRWLRYWVNPYDRLTNGIPWLDALEESPVKEEVTATAGAEEARLLYVGFTRARDLLIVPTGKPGAPWVDRVYGRGGGRAPVFPPQEVTTPLTWSGTDVNKTNRHYTEPTAQPRSEVSHRSLPFIAGARPGRAAHPSLLIDDSFLLARFSDTQLATEHRYFDHAEVDPAVMGRPLGQVVAAFLQGDPGPGGDPHLRLEIAEQLAVGLRESDGPDAAYLIAVGNAYAALTSGLWQENGEAIYDRPLIAQLGDRQYRGSVRQLIRESGDALTVVGQTTLTHRQFSAQSAIRLAELRLQADLLEGNGEGTVRKIFLHLASEGRLMEVRR